ncbi:endonuclease [Leptothoe kymatousa TAU-MAC 1615]|uniref:Endonuclease n=2 Tax=Leptothoe TaxID=2651725 RepID=A0ABS5Y4L4_9CYAN|nr:endonuclease [Leptothoe kymatousa TAU-MAC 1615]
MIKKILSLCLAVGLSLGLMVAPAFALDLSPGDRIILRATNPQGVPLHETSSPSLVDRAATGTVAEVIDTVANSTWVKLRLPNGEERWVVERYIESAIAPDPEAAVPPEDNPGSSPEETLLPNLRGEALRRQLAEDFDVENSLGYRRARDYMFSQLDNNNGVVRGIYSGFEQPIRPNSRTPRSDAFQNGRGLNAEHSWPQSRGATGVAKSDLHHLFPSQVSVNSRRGSLPFAEIDDTQTRWWLIAADETNAIPTTNIDAYSEATQGAFEPREQVKGDIARAQFYFYTIYRNQADTGFFQQQRNVLCSWNAIDPVSTQEQQRSTAIASQQGNENPFVLDPSLANRLYCER